MRELQTGLWHWEAPHPDWKPGEEWDQMVSSYAIDDGERLLLFDPLASPSEIKELAAGRETAIVLTCPWHERDAHRLVEELGAPVFSPRPDEGSGDAAWLDTVEAHQFSAGGRLRVGVETFPGLVANDIVLWAESGRAVIAGDTLIDRGHGLEILEGLRPLLELPVEHVLATHGGPADRTALERALS